jgi:hypothetical protein
MLQHCLQSESELAYPKSLPNKNEHVRTKQKTNELTVSQSVRALSTVLLCALYSFVDFSFLRFCIGNRASNIYTIIGFRCLYVYFVSGNKLTITLSYRPRT